MGDSAMPASRVDKNHPLFARFLAISHSEGPNFLHAGFRYKKIGNGESAYFIRLETIWPEMGQIVTDLGSGANSLSVGPRHAGSSVEAFRGRDKEHGSEAHAAPLDKPVVEEEPVVKDVEGEESVVEKRKPTTRKKV